MQLGKYTLRLLPAGRNSLAGPQQPSNHVVNRWDDFWPFVLYCPSQYWRALLALLLSWFHGRNHRCPKRLSGASSFKKQAGATWMEGGFPVRARLRAQCDACRNSEGRRRSGAWQGMGVQQRDPRPPDGGGRRRPGRADQGWARPPPGGAGQGGTREMKAGFVRRVAGAVMRSEARRAGEGGPARQLRQQPALRSMAAAPPRRSPRWAPSSPPCHRQCHCHASPGAPGLRARPTETQPVPGQRPGAGNQVRAGGRWRRGEDEPGGQLHHQRVPRRVPAHRPRHLLR